jgi:hypothetical protein
MNVWVTEGQAIVEPTHMAAARTQQVLAFATLGGT